MRGVQEAMKRYECEFGFRKHPDCPCQGTLWKARRTPRIAGSLGSTLLPEGDLHSTRLRVKVGNAWVTLRTLLVMDDIKAMNCPMCDGLLIGDDQRMLCPNCNGPIYPTDAIREKVKAELGDELGDFDELEDVKILAIDDGSAKACLVLYY